MVDKRKGAIVLMTSLAGLQGSGYLSVYASTKAFNRILAESLWYEWKNSGVDVIGCCAGATATPGYKNTNPEKSGFFAPQVLEPEEVAKECLRMLEEQTELHHLSCKRSCLVTALIIVSLTGKQQDNIIQWI